MQGHEVFLDLLAYNRDIIKMDSFTDYNDQLKVTQAYLNRILPSELVLNISQKCVLLVEGNFMLEFYDIKEENQLNFIRKILNSYLSFFRNQQGE